MSIRRAITAGMMLFGTLAMLALLSPVGSAHDELYHAASIWCARGERYPYCTDVQTDVQGGRSALTNIDAIYCNVPVIEPLTCNTDRSDQLRYQVNNGMYPPVFYRAMSYAVVPSVDTSFVLIRVLNALVATVVLVWALLVLPKRHRTALVLVAMGTFSPHVLYLFSSLNPSSWTTLGIGVGSIALHATVSISDLSRRQQVSLAFLAALSYVLALGSRWDAVGFIAVTVAVTVIVSKLPLIRRRPVQVISSVLLAVVAAVLILEKLSPLPVSPYLADLLKYSDGEPNNLSFITHNLLHVVPKLTEALGDVPAHNGVYIPDIVFVLGVAVLAHILVIAYNRDNQPQWMGAGFIVLSASILMMFHSGTTDDRGPFGPSVRYVVPLFVVVVAWWLMNASDDLPERVERHFVWMIPAVTFAFFVSAFNIAERSVDRQTFGFRILPESANDWWWPHLPVGPNVVVLCATACMWGALHQYALIVREPSSVVTE